MTTLLRAFLRRDRWHLLWWTLGVTVLYYSQAVSVRSLYPTQADFDRAAASMQHNSAFIAMAGPARALNTIGGQVTWQAAGGGAVAVGLMSMILIGRHTRAEEESGRDELVRSGVIARRTPALAALAVAVLANALVGAVVALSLISFPLAAADSVALGLGLALTGTVFAGVALLAAQLTSSTRAMYGMTGAVIAAAFALRAIGDIGDGTLSWLSPIGWYQRMYAFSDLRWWPALLLLAAGAITVAGAMVVFDRRDIGAGILAARPGPARAAGGLATPIGLAWRLQRGSVLGWTGGLLVTGLAYGSIGNDVGTLVGDSTTSQEIFGRGGDLVDGFYAVSMIMLALLVSGFAVSSALRPRAEEDSGHLEPLLATGLSRSRWLLGHLFVTVAGTLACLVAAGLGLGVGYALVTGDAGAVRRLVAQMLGLLPAVLVVAAVGRLLFGLVPRWAGLAWLLLAFAVVVLMFGTAWRMPGWLRGLSPFEHLALVPVESFDPLAFVGVLAVATLVSAGGWFAFRSRDIG